MRPQDSIVPSQLPLCLPSRRTSSRSDFIVASCNADAVALIDVWPEWPVFVIGLFGPSGCGKSHLVSAWREKSQAQVLSAGELSRSGSSFAGPVAIENVDLVEATPGRDAVLIGAFENASARTPVVLTGRGKPANWPCSLPDLASRFRAMAALPLWAPDERLLGALARKLFTDRQLVVPEPVITHMLRVLERSPSAIRRFVEEADAAALAQGRPVNLALVRAVITAREHAAP